MADSKTPEWVWHDRYGKPEDHEVEVGIVQRFHFSLNERVICVEASDGMEDAEGIIIGFTPNEVLVDWDETDYGIQPIDSADIESVEDMD